MEKSCNRPSVRLWELDKKAVRSTKSLAEIKENIKERADLASIVGRHTKLVKSGRGYKACCPLPGHKEKSPSFHIDTRQNLYFCYGCNRGGDVFTFLQVVEGLPFMEALKELGDSMGIEIPRGNFSKTESVEQRSFKELGFDILARASKFYHRVLVDRATPGAEKAYDYLVERGISVAEIEKLELGWAPERGSPLLKRVKENSNEEYQIALATGLVREYGSRAYDFFQDRLMIPIFDARARPVAFSGRTLAPVTSENPKYKNSPESDWFKKKETLYGLERAAKLIREENFVCIVEGYFDQWAFERFEVPAVAVMGTALGEDHLRLLSRHTRQCILVLDADKAGVNSTKKSLPLLLSHEWDVKVFSELEGKDPDEWLKSHPKGNTEIKRKLLSAPESLEWWAKLLLREGQEKNLNRLQIFHSLVEVWQMARSLAHHNILADEIARHLGLSSQEVKESLGELARKNPGTASRPERPVAAARSEMDFMPRVSQNFVPKTAYKTPIEGAAEELFIWWLRHFDILSPQSHEEWQNRERLFTGTPAEKLVLAMGAEAYKSGQAWTLAELQRTLLNSEIMTDVLRQWVLKGLVDPGYSTMEDKAKILISFNEFAAILDREKVNSEIAKIQADIRSTSTDAEKTAQLLQKVQDLRMSLEKRK